MTSYVHRFGILKAADGRLGFLSIRGGARTGAKDDGALQGAVWAAPLSDNLEQYTADNQLKLTMCCPTYQVQSHGFWTA